MIAPKIQVGDVFERIDKNLKTWTAEVVNRTDYFVDVLKTNPYNHTQSTERASIIILYEEVKTGNVLKENGLYGEELIEETKKVETDVYAINLVDNVGGYDKLYKCDKRIGKSYQEGLDLFHKFCEE